MFVPERKLGGAEEDQERNVAFPAKKKTRQVAVAKVAGHQTEGGGAGEKTSFYSLKKARYLQVYCV